HGQAHASYRNAVADADVRKIQRGRGDRQPQVAAAWLAARNGSGALDDAGEHSSFESAGREGRFWIPAIGDDRNEDRHSRESGNPVSSLRRSAATATAYPRQCGVDPLHATPCGRAYGRAATDAATAAPDHPAIPARCKAVIRPPDPPRTIHRTAAARPRPAIR